jgi:hypothetical protein
MERGGVAMTAVSSLAADRPIGAQPSRGAQLFVWGAWVGMVAIAIWHFAHYARNIPLAEDWNLVAPLTGQEPNLGAWLWSQNNEHRLPLPRLVMLALLKASHGDFRSGMIFSITMVALLAAGMIEAARRLRGGRVRYTDAFFPIVLLEVGDWQDLFWHWQLAFVLSVVLVGLGLLTIITRPGLNTPGAAAAVGAALVLAPLTGGSGLLFVPPLMLYAGWRGVQLARGSELKSERRGGFMLIGAVAVTASFIALYLAGYERPEWVPRNPGLGKSILTAVQFQTFGLGPAVRTSWTFWSAVALLLLLAATVRVFQVFRLARRNDPTLPKNDDRLRALGLLAGLLSVAGFAAAIGWGRAAVIDVYHGWPDRYVLLATPAFCLAYFAWELPGREGTNRLGRGLLFGFAALLLPMNTAFGREWGAWYVGGMDHVIRDIRAGTPRDVLATRHREFLYHPWTPELLAEHMQMLHDHKMGPFAAMITDVDTTLPAVLDSVTLRYHLPEAGAVRLVWWFRDGRHVPLPIRPPGTTIANQGSAVSTPMHREDSAFTVTLQVPPGDSLEYGFLITARSGGDTLSGLWDGVRRYEPDTGGGNAVVDGQPTVSLLTDPPRAGDTVLVRETVRYGPTDAHRVRVVWGIDGWQRLPVAQYPPRTRTTTSHLMLTPMEHGGSMFETTLVVPAGHHLDFSFQLDRADRFDVSDDNHGTNYGLTATGDSTVTVTPNLTRVTGSSLSTVFITGAVALLALGVLAIFSALAGKLVSRAIP